MQSVGRSTTTTLNVRGDEWPIKIFNCSQNLNECSPARARKIFAVAGMLVFLSGLLFIE